MNVGIVGLGQVGFHLTKKLIELKFNVYISSRNPEAPKIFPNSQFFSLNKIPKDIDILFLTVPDDVIDKVAHQISIALGMDSSPILVHTSGATPIDVLCNFSRNYGCFYPLNSFRKEKEVNWQDTPIFIEGSNEEVLKILNEIALKFSKYVHILPSSKRAILHIGAVFCANFSNFMYLCAENLLRSENIPFHYLVPIIKEVATRLEKYSPYEMQTGPAVRRDIKTIRKHLELLLKFPLLRNIYERISLAIMEKYKIPQVYNFESIKVVAFDIDGVMTDGTLFPTENGEFIRNMNIKDGYALQFSVKQGLEVVVISGSYSHAFTRRFSYLGIKHIYLEIENKLAFFDEIVKKYNWNYEEIAYMGDDIPDIPLLEKVGLSCAPADAAPEVKARVKYVSPYPGGKGAVRDLIQKILSAQNKWPETFGEINTSFLW